jgi:hypothetical protein
MFMDIAHEKLITVFLRENISQVKTGTAVSRLMNMVTNGLDVIVNEKVYILFALLVIDASLDDMEEMGDHTTSGKTLPHVVKIKTPGIG